VKIIAGYTRLRCNAAQFGK